MLAIMGVTGQVGGAAARSLIERGEQIRAIVRSPEKGEIWRRRGAEIALADFNDAEALTRAFAGAEGVFVMIPPNFAPEPGFLESRAIIAAIRGALSAARPLRIVALSTIGAQRESGIGLLTALHVLEEELGSIGLPAAFLRAGWFMENSIWDVPAARQEGKMYSFLQPLDKPFSLVATEDVGSVAAENLHASWQGNRFIEVAGPKQYSPAELAAAFSKVLGRSIEPVVIPRSAWQQSFEKQGTAADRTAFRIEMLDGFNSGWISFGVPGTEHVAGTTTFEAVLAELVRRA
jgi:NAD(P)H dehydrogenase (quinone)